MAKRTRKKFNLIRYLLFTVIVLLVTVSLLSLFVFKYANFTSSENVVLGASIIPNPPSVTCESCAQSVKGSVGIILQRSGTDVKSWGAKCATQEMLNTVKYITFMACPTPVSIGNIH
jgi:hypothetical protein